MDTTLKNRLRALLEKDEPSRRESGIRRKVAKFLRNEEKVKDQRGPADRGSGPGKMGKITRPDPLDTGGPE